MYRNGLNSGRMDHNFQSSLDFIRKAILHTHNTLYKPHTFYTWDLNPQPFGWGALTQHPVNQSLMSQTVFIEVSLNIDEAS